MIEILDDPRIAVYRDLKATNRTRRCNQFVVEGEKLFERLRDSRFPLISVVADERHEARVSSMVPEGVPLYVLSSRLMEMVVGFNFHQGVLAAGERRPWPDLEAILAGCGPRSTWVVCPRVDNPENLGALIRLGDVFGVDGLLRGPRCPDPLSRRVLRVSMGTALRLPVVSSSDLVADVARLTTRFGFTTVATVTDPGAEPIDALARDRPDRLALLFGSESAGLEPEWVAALRPVDDHPDAPGGRIDQPGGRRGDWRSTEFVIDFKTLQHFVLIE